VADGFSTTARAWLDEDHRRRRLVGLILLVGLVLRVGWILYVDAVDPQRSLNPDSQSYIESSEALFDEGRFSRSADDPTPMFVRTPGYPVYLGLIRTLAGDSLVWPLIGQAVLAALASLVVYLLAARLFDSVTAVLTLVLVTLDPLQMAFAGAVLTEALFSVLFLVAVYAIVRHLEQAAVTIRWAGVAGLSLATATLVRPASYYLPLACAIALLVPVWTEGLRLRRAVAGAGLLLLPVVVLVGGWQVRNAEQVGSARVSGVEAINLYWYDAAATLADESGRPIDDVRDELSVELFDDLAVPVEEPRDHRRGTLPPEGYERQGEVYGAAYDRALEIIVDHPVGFARVWGEGLARVLFSPGKTEVLGYFAGPGSVPPVVAAAAVGAVLLTWVLGGVGFLRALKDRDHRLAHAVIAVMGVYLLVVSSGAWSEARMRVPVTPLVLMYAAVAVVSLARRVEARSL
jgi:Dolichyl-phosphate-mannose-protein mannosyltransferase